MSTCSAEGWNLANPIATCTIEVLKQDDALLILFMTERPKKGGPPGSTEPHLFAQSHITLDVSPQQQSTTTTTNTTSKTTLLPPKPGIEHWVESVVDSSRYFVIRISNEKTGRTAHIGMGFRDRDCAFNFKMALQEYQNSLKKDQLAQQQSSLRNNENYCNTTINDEKSSSLDGDGLCIEKNTSLVSKLTLKEGKSY